MAASLEECMENMANYYVARRLTTLHLKRSMALDEWQALPSELDMSIVKFNPAPIGRHQLGTEACSKLYAAARTGDPYAKTWLQKKTDRWRTSMEELGGWDKWRRSMEERAPEEKAASWQQWHQAMDDGGQEKWSNAMTNGGYDQRRRSMEERAPEEKAASLEQWHQADAGAKARQSSAYSEKLAAVKGPQIL